MKRSIEDEIFRKNNPTVAEYCEKWLKMRSASVRENTLSGYERTIKKIYYWRYWRYVYGRSDDR